MKSVTFIKLTEKERLAMVRTEEALEELIERVCAYQAKATFDDFKKISFLFS